MFSLPAFLEGFVQASAHVFFAYDPTIEQVLYLNAAATAVLDLRPELAEATAQLPDLLARLHPDDRPYLAALWPRWQAGEAGLPRIEVRLTCPDGSIRWLALTPYHHPAEPGVPAPAWVGGTIEDISVAKAYILNADQFNAKKNATLEILSHDLAHPFILLQQLADYVADEVGPTAQAELTRQLETMRTICQDGVSLIRDFVDHEFLQSAQVTLKLERHDLVALVGAMLEEYQGDQHLIAKRFLLTASHPAIYVMLDYNKVQQVVNNLVSNAIKFTTDGGEIRVIVEEHVEQVRLIIADNGVGIPAAHLPEVFERFTPARRPGLRGEKTTGLGLSIVKTVVELHKGRIRVESEEGQGTAFHIELARAAG